VISTGLPYLIVPLRAGLTEARIVHPRFGDLLAQIGAQFVYVLDVGAIEGRTWDNDGRVEDIATGSAAGPVGAYLVRHGHAQPGTEIVIHQGRFVGRPSEIAVRVDGETDAIRSVLVRGDVRMVASGRFD
jgi:PhzF family phenazine biosynthesis protein